MKYITFNLQQRVDYSDTAIYTVTIPIVADGDAGTLVYMTVDKQTLKKSTSAQTVTATVWKRVGDGAPTDITSTMVQAGNVGYGVYWRLVNASGVGSPLTFGATATLSASTTYTVVLLLYYFDTTSATTTSTPIQTITIPCVTDGEQGIQGCIVRVSEWVEGVEYRNDTALTSGTRYLDIVTVTSDSGSWTAYQCKKTHTASSSITPTNTTYWTEFNTLAPVYTPMLLAEYAKFRFGQTNQILVQDEDGNIIAGMGGGNYPIWAGGESPGTAPFRVGMDGSLYAVNAILEGVVRAVSGSFGCLQVEGNDLVGYDSNAKECVRIGIGNVPTVSDAFTTEFIEFGMTSDKANCNVYKHQTWGYYVGEASCQAGANYDRETGELTTDNSIAATITFSLSQTATKVTIGHLDVDYSTTSGSVTGTATGTAKIYRKSSSTWVLLKTTELSAMTDDIELTGSLAAGSYKIEVTGSIEDISTTASWVGELHIYVGGGIRVTTASGSTTDGGRLVIAKDGLLSITDSTHFMFFSGDTGFEVRFGNYGLKVSSAGVQTYSNNTWKSL
jgi:hypothetical protein